MQAQPNLMSYIDTPATSPPTVLGKTLIGKAAGWEWVDGQPEPGVEHLRLDQVCDFGLTVLPGQGTWVEVPDFEVSGNSFLRWVGENNYRRRVCRDPVSRRKWRALHPKQPVPCVTAYLVPFSDWQERAAQVVGACWDATQNERILARARSLGAILPDSPADPQAQAPRALRPQHPPCSITFSEFKLIVDALNGIHLSRFVDPTYYEMLAADCGSIRGISGIGHEIEDAIAINHLDKRWGVDGDALLDKIESLSPEARKAILLRVEDFWDAEDRKIDEVFHRLQGDLAAIAGRYQGIDQTNSAKSH
jgi:hypothetical protein